MLPPIWRISLPQVKRITVDILEIFPVLPSTPSRHSMARAACKATLQRWWGVLQSAVKLADRETENL